MSQQPRFNIDLCSEVIQAISVKTGTNISSRHSDTSLHLTAREQLQTAVALIEHIDTELRRVDELMKVRAHFITPVEGSPIATIRHLLACIVEGRVIDITETHGTSSPNSSSTSRPYIANSRGAFRQAAHDLFSKAVEQGRQTPMDLETVPGTNQLRPMMRSREEVRAWRVRNDEIIEAFVKEWCDEG